MVLCGMTQELSNFPDDTRGFTEVWGKATWDYVKAKVMATTSKPNPPTHNVSALNAFLQKKENKNPNILTESCPYLQKSRHKNHG